VNTSHGLHPTRAAGALRRRVRTPRRHAAGAATRPQSQALSWARRFTCPL